MLDSWSLAMPDYLKATQASKEDKQPHLFSSIWLLTKAWRVGRAYWVKAAGNASGDQGQYKCSCGRRHQPHGVSVLIRRHQPMSKWSSRCPQIFTTCVIRRCDQIFGVILIWRKCQTSSQEEGELLFRRKLKDLRGTNYNTVRIWPKMNNSIVSSEICHELKS